MKRYGKYDLFEIHEMLPYELEVFALILNNQAKQEEEIRKSQK